MDRIESEIGYNNSSFEQFMIRCREFHRTSRYGYLARMSYNAGLSELMSRPVYTECFRPVVVADLAL